MADNTKSIGNFSSIVDWQRCSAEEQRQLLTRPAISASDRITAVVSDILTNVKSRGDSALRDYSAQFDKVQVNAIRVTDAEITAASARLGDEVKQAMAIAVRNIETFHNAQKLPIVDIETQPGVRCQQITRPIATVGLYIPGGSAPLPSTVLMLGTPSRIAGCDRVVLCSPPPIADEILYAAQLCGIKEVFQLGGAQAIAAMAFGTDSVPKVDKIFGPGNAYVTEAKRQVSQQLDGAAIDMPAGPSEVLVIADSGATPAFVASDLLSQAEHGPDSQVILLTPDAAMAKAVADAVEEQLTHLSRADIARQALASSRVIVARDLAQCVEISNQYGPEHLIIQTRDAESLVDSITSAGSVFLGDWSPESAGDYASGTNHVLPTYGYTSTYSSLGLADFQKRMTVQQLTPQGLLQLAPTIETLAQAEQLTAHKNAVTLRVAALKEQA
ncbi:histidinol dehydrogenase [Pectobacterium parmentieri]|uniref:Histidinol dehydrogenase n=1 Tax=Pectobacterium parmentieri TaxID=1905730 RepID=A0A0H3I1W5_PECPM|nr:histidinol dehydrogenase [Pectobacterium parmentieri]AFI90047.1 Histidinol dehydrogenase [Pectobacterium parmentieri]MBI0472493.1 histidinol dehydrogenase [Pectobacterium parmentieri]MBI0495137.1 histidinol dehydrogenase [Pectobacterium parmentieri]MBI0556472.1 histidinol dehydrogenase [Pectobacterium parmentieri]MBI0569674.1 histidinol dehydrogenase [Pectobacterium parmentieri]